VAGIQAFVPDMLLGRRYGRVVNIVSTAIGRTVPFTSAYDTAKRGPRAADAIPRLRAGPGTA
jgi:hypothetical protein